MNDQMKSLSNFFSAFKKYENTSSDVRLALDHLINSF